MEILLIHNIFQNHLNEVIDVMLRSKFKLKPEKDFILSDLYTFAYTGKVKNMKLLESEFKKILKPYTGTEENSVVIYFNGAENNFKKIYIN